MKRLYVIRDNVAKAAAGPVMTFAHDAVATREFRDIALNQKSSLNAHMEDYDLLCIGEFEEESCEIGGYGQPTVVVSGAALKAMQERDAQPQLALEA